MNTSKSKHIRVHIERLILDGLSVLHSQRSRLQTAIEEELTHLLTNGTLSRSGSANARPTLQPERWHYRINRQRRSQRLLGSKSRKPCTRGLDDRANKR